MDQLQVFSDERLLGMCVYCGGAPETVDHVPSKTLLNLPYPQNLPVVDACRRCNESFSLEEEYVCCLIACVLAGSSDPDQIADSKASRILRRKHVLRTRIVNAMKQESGRTIFSPESGRVRNVVLKLGRGHAAYGLSLPQFDEPSSITFAPFLAMSREQIQAFESPTDSGLWPEIGSRAFQRAALGWQGPNVGGAPSSGWLEVQRDKYRYLAEEAPSVRVRIVLSEYLACEVRWDD